MKVLQMTSALDGGGIERILFDYYAHMDHDQVQFDFVKVDPEEGILEKPLREMGCHIYAIPPMRQNHKEYCEILTRILQEGQYDVIHCNGGYRAAEALRIAKKAGVPMRLAHAHTAGGPETSVQKLERKIATMFVKHYATHLFGCGEMAAKWMWGAGAISGQKATVVHNAIRTERFRYDPLVRAQYRRELDLEGKFVLGHVGRLSFPKNHEFLLRAFAEAVKKSPDLVLLLIGRGELEAEVVHQIEALHLQNHVRLMGVRDDIPQLLNALDLFVMPSRWEGLPVALVEVQANGLPALVSDTVTQEIQINENVKYLPLEEGVWANEMSEAQENRISDGAERVKMAGYDIQTEAAKLQGMYFTPDWR